MIMMFQKPLHVSSRISTRGKRSPTSPHTWNHRSLPNNLNPLLKSRKPSGACSMVLSSRGLAVWSSRARVVATSLPLPLGGKKYRL